ncbi:MAG: cyclic nucleotide-binding domain-containing protein [Chloroflexi bacterium]|nr:cyclic nucleotide-binding domain-containing protein [Chloroflexota bacterium]MCI0576721.1 cyclic nucleotide-binding domain-containing protein [Chloroflexota bacterium]MCI0645533.1 cyclic nucleotide-binding domain-containing protein [Chloroflexota bacterium]MCI0728892.1 cyclic nucleotide-binding domain-containing protein [Chloroflexota bacterium]
MFAVSPKFGPEHYPAGTIIFGQGDIPDKFYIITRGQVEIIRRRTDGRETIINRLNAGEFFGEIGLLKKSRRVATVRAATDVDLMAMDYQTFLDWLNSSVLSRDEINAVMQQRISTIEELHLVEGESGEETRRQSLYEQGEGGTGRQGDTPTPPHPHTPTLPHSDSGPQYFGPGELIIRQGEIADKFYIIVDGQVEVTQREPDGREKVINRLGAGNYFGEIGLMEGGRRGATVRAASPVSVVAFDRSTFSRWLSQAPFAQQELKEAAQRRLATHPPQADE